MSAKKQNLLSVIRVGKSGAKKVFRFGDYKAAELDPYKIMGEPSGTNPEADSFNVEVYRDGQLFDSGRIGYVGGHDDSHHFFGLRQTCSKARRHPRNVDMLADNLQAAWFEVGDEIRVNRV